MKKVKDEFVVGKNNIGYVDSTFTSEFGSDDLGEGKVLTFKKLGRNMYDTDIIKEFNVQECTMADVLATINAVTQDMKDGYSNIFYVKDHPSRVVGVRWYSGHGGWFVGDWFRDDDAWRAVGRVFSPATDILNPSSGLSDSKTLSPDVCECPRCKECGKRIIK